MKRINTLPTKEDLTNLYNEGYRFYCEGEYTFTDEISPWSGRRCWTKKWFAFTTIKEANEFSNKQNVPYERVLKPRIVDIADRIGY